MKKLILHMVCMHADQLIYIKFTADDDTAMFAPSVCSCVDLYTHGQHGTWLYNWLLHELT